MKFKSLETLCWAMIAACLVILAVLAWRYPNAPAQPPRTPLLVKECVAVTVDGMGNMTETPTECLQPTSSGCSGSIRVTVLEDGTVQTSCPEGVTTK